MAFYRDNDSATKADSAKKIKEIRVKENCKKFTIKLTHIGKIPMGMGHNIVITPKSELKNAQRITSKAGMKRSKDGDFSFLVPTDNKVILASSARTLNGNKEVSPDKKESEIINIDLSMFEKGGDIFSFALIQVITL